jgi:hypothetical protein
VTDMATEPTITVERMASDKVWEAKGLLMDAYAMILETSHIDRAEVRRTLSAAQRLLMAAKALL